MNQPVTSKTYVISKSEGAKVQTVQVPQPSVPTEYLRSKAITDEEEKKISKILSQIPDGESQSYKDYISLDIPCIII